MNWFNEKHLVRDYLNDMHPFVDPNDRKSPNRTLSRKQHTRATEGTVMEHNDFLDPSNPLSTHPRRLYYFDNLYYNSPPNLLLI